MIKWTMNNKSVNGVSMIHDSKPLIHSLLIELTFSKIKYRNGSLLDLRGDLCTEEFDVGIKWASPRISKEYINVRTCLRNTKGMMEYEEADLKTWQLFRKYHENRYKYEETPLTWVEFAQSEGGKFRPPLPLHLLLENTTINEIIVEVYDLEQFWVLMKQLDSTPSTINNKIVICPKFAGNELDSERCRTSEFLKNGVHTFGISGTTFDSSFLQLPQFHDTQWKLFHIKSNKFLELPDLSLQRLKIVDGSGSLRQFILNLLENPQPISREWICLDLKNEDQVWGWDTLEETLDTVKSLSWTMKEISPFNK
ncbi:hypothetical protein WR25_04193, partial [Diploscapter pachys]